MGAPKLLPGNQQEELQELAALYALGALTQHEARALENRLAEDLNGMAEELAAFENVAAHLAFAAPEQTPPVSLRQNLLAKIANESESPSRPEFHLPVAPRNDFSEMFSLRAGES